MDIEEVRRALQLSEEAATTLTRLASVEVRSPALRPPSSRKAEHLFSQLNVAEADRAELLAARSMILDTPELMWLLRRCHAELVENMGRPAVVPGWPDLPTRYGPAGRYFYAWVFLAAREDVRAYHSSRGIPEDITWASLGEMGLHMVQHRAVTGVGGLSSQQWLTGHYSGVNYRIGALLFERQRIWFTASDARGPVPSPGDSSLGIHIPRGSLAPDACDAAVVAAVRFFATHFPEEPCQFGTCVSWLLDDQLSDHLAPSSNIIRFQRRFTLLPSDSEPGTRLAVEMIYAQPWPGRGEALVLPQRTSLERAVVSHIAAGKDLYFRTGWLVLPTAQPDE